MEKWEYMWLTEILTNGENTAKLNELGEQGWEAVGISGFNGTVNGILLKRRLP